jgi:hypothetical protein
VLTGTGAIAVLSLFAAPLMSGEEPVSGSAPQATQAVPDVQLETVPVEARRRRERIDSQVSEFVSSIVGPAKVDSLARWKGPVCVVTVGLAAAEGDFVKKRIEKIATDAGVAPGRPDCAPNFVVIVTPDPEAVLRDWWSEEHRLFNQDRGLGGVRRFLEIDRPVRVWHNACNVPPGLAGYFSPVEFCGVGVTGTRLKWAAVRAIYTALVGVDLTQIEGLTFGQVSDYVAMVGLAQIRPDPDPGDASTILGLFSASGADRQKGVTAWDQSFLKALYATTDGSVTELTQIKLRMSDDLAR